MFGSMVLEVAIGVIFVYLLLSLIVTAVSELISGWLKWRAQNLWTGVQNLIDSGEAESWAKKLYEHPLIQGLSPAVAKPAAKAKAPAGTAPQAAQGPSYIPSRTFTIALLEIIKDRETAGELAIKALRRGVETLPDTASIADLKSALRSTVQGLPAEGAAGDLKSEILTVIDRLPDDIPLAEGKKAVRTYLAALPDRWLQMAIDNLPADSKLKKSLAALLEESHRDVEHFKENIEIWFNNSMARVSGWYKRKTQVVHMILAVAVTVVINVDTVLVVDALSQNQSLRQSLVSEAEAYAKKQETTAPGAQPSATTPATGTNPLTSIDQIRAELAKLDLPVGWVLPGHASFDAKNGNFRGWPGWHPYGSKPGSTTAWLVLWGQTIRFHLLGWLLTAFAISLGAPFWFDMLNKVINIRSSGKAPEEKPKAPKKVPQPLEPGQIPGAGG